MDELYEPGRLPRLDGSCQHALGQILLNSTHELTAALINAGHCLVADEAYAANDILAVLWPGSGRGDQWKDSYNFYQSSSRMHIEQAFGMLSWR